MNILTTLWAMGWLAAGYKKIGKIHDSLRLQEKVVDASKRVLGEEHPETIEGVKMSRNAVSRDTEGYSHSNNILLN